MATFIQNARDILAKNVATAGRVLNLGENNISERIAGTKPQQTYTSTYYNPYQVSRDQAPSSTPTVLGVSTGSYGPSPSEGSAVVNQGGGSQKNLFPNSGVTVSGSGSNPQQNYSRTLDTSRDVNVNMIDEQFNQEMGRLSGLENTTRGNYQSAVQQAQQYFPQFQAELAKQKQTDLNVVQGQEDQAKIESNRGLARTRQLLNDLQRSQASRLSAGGNYSSSLADAYGESFGRKAFEANSAIQQARDSELQRLGVERQKTENFYSQKALQAKQDYDNQIIGLERQLQSQLDQINNARGVASNTRSQATAEAWANYTQNKLNLDNYMMQYQDSLDQWKNKQTAYIDEAEKYTTQGTAEDVLGTMRGDQVSFNSAVGTQPQSAIQQAQILARAKKPLTWEEEQAQVLTG